MSMTKRTFLALELPPSVRTWVQTLQQSYEAQLRVLQLPSLLRWTKPEQLHITLRFFGETTLQQEERIAGALDALASRTGVFQLYLNETGCFPLRGAPQVVWVGIHGDMLDLHRCQQHVEHIAQDAGFAAETRAFSPHLTIARAQRNAARNQLMQARQILCEPGLATNPAAASGQDARRIPVRQLVFMQSELLPGGARYTPLRHFTFA